MQLALILPGPIEQLTGGYLFAHQIVEALRRGGDEVDVIELPGNFPDADAIAREAAAAALAALPDGTAAVIDGLALPGFAACLLRETQRIKLLGFIHHPLAEETGLTEEEATTMVVSGFIEPLVKELPMEYAVEMNRLIQLQMESSIG